MVGDDACRAKLAKVENLFRRAGCRGERAGAGAAMDRLHGRLGGSDKFREPEVELKFSLPDMWSVRLFFEVCRKHGLYPPVFAATADDRHGARSRASLRSSEDERDSSKANGFGPWSRYAPSWRAANRWICGSPSDNRPTSWFVGPCCALVMGPEQGRKGVGQGLLGHGDGAVAVAAHMLGGAVHGHRARTGDCRPRRAPSRSGCIPRCRGRWRPGARSTGATLPVWRRRRAWGSSDLSAVMNSRRVAAGAWGVRTTRRSAS